MNSVTVKPQRRELLIRNDNFLVRDHQIMGVRVLPGVAALEIVCRIGQEIVGSLDFSLVNVAFLKPIATSSACDRRLRVSLTPADDDDWEVLIESQAVRSAADSDEKWTAHVSCTLQRSAASPPTDLDFDIGLFVERTPPVFSMEDVYAEITRPIGFIHKGVMKADGMIYHRNGEEVMALTVNHLAETHRSKFLAHPALLDAATMGGVTVAHLANGKLVAPSLTYVPVGFREFRLHAPFGRGIYVLSKPDPLGTGDGEVPAIMSRSMKLYDLQGRLVAHYDRMTARPTDFTAMLARLAAEISEDKASAAPRGTPVRSGEASERIDVSGDGERTDASAPASSVPNVTAEDYLMSRIGALLGGNVDIRAQRDVPFYDLGLASSDLVDLTQELEQACGCELNAGLMYEHPTVGELAKYLQARHPGKFCTA